VAGAVSPPVAAPAGRALNLTLATSTSVVCFWAWNSIATLSAYYTQHLHLNPATTGVLVAMPVFVGGRRQEVGSLTRAVMAASREGAAGAASG